jgi:alpha,alpha-trehalase
VPHVNGYGLLCYFLALAMAFVPNSSSDVSRDRSSAQIAGMKEASQSFESIRQYISVGWGHLTRALDKCDTFEDIKAEGEQVLYLPVGLPSPLALNEVQKRCRVRFDRLPGKITAPGEIDLNKIQTEGLLYLPNPYVVPGGQFNEMYGWDSYFIIRGLLRDNRKDLAKGMVENFFFEIENYGGVLNANRTYYLSRSQPPFLTSMILAVYEADKSAGQPDLRWLEKAYRFAVRDYEQWSQPPHLAGDTGLSRYFDHGEGPVPEIRGDPSHYYRGVAQFFLIHGGTLNAYLIHGDKERPASSVPGLEFPVFVCDSQAEQPEKTDCAAEDRIALTSDFYKGDRSMRESGFDISFRFGPFGADTHHYAPVCLNSLLYKTERDLELMSVLLGRREDAERWRSKALERRKIVDKYLWDRERGLFFDYDFVTHTRSSYEYATTFYPLWAGLASEEQARAVARNLRLFEEPGGLAMSRRETQAQWDYPYGWAPIHLLAVEGLLRYGYKADADRIAYSFLSMVMENFEHDKTIREKYNVVTRSSETHIGEGYSQNVIGFGWTNGVFLGLLDEMPPGLIERLKKE